jgi:two-component system, OmpR family, phosphate regulon sensor histidine kinase PhoR
MRLQILLGVWAIINTVAALILVVSAGGRAAWVGLAAAALSTAAFAIYAWFAWRRLARYLRRLEDYTASLPSKGIDLPSNLPAEFAMLSSALQRTSDHVGSVIGRANLELARRETILAGLAEGVLAVDRNLSVTFCNDAFADAFQTRRPVPEGKPLYEVVREPALRQILLDVVASGTISKQRLHLPAAGGRWFEIQALPLGGASHAGAIAVLHDVTDIQRQEQARKDFVANVSHELRTPLAAIRGYAETLLDGGLEDKANNRKFVEVIQSQAIRLNNIASDLLVLSELDSKAPVTPPAPIPVDQVVEAAVRTVESAAAMREVSIQCGGCEGAVVLANRLRLEQVLVNLLDNAVKFNRTRGTVAIDWHRGESCIELTITDTGMGIPSEDLKRIFERFYRVDKARSRQVGGTGLGLSIVKESIEGMGGTVAVESQLGVGTKFRLQLPAA